MAAKFVAISFSAAAERRFSASPDAKRISTTSLANTGIASRQIEYTDAKTESRNAPSLYIAAKLRLGSRIHPGSKGQDLAFRRLDWSLFWHTVRDANGQRRSTRTIEDLKLNTNQIL